LRLLALRDGTLRHADLEAPSLLAEGSGSLADSLGRSRVLGRARVAVVGQFGARLQPVLQRADRLHTIRCQVLRECFVVARINEVVQRLTQQFVLQRAISKFPEIPAVSQFEAGSPSLAGQLRRLHACLAHSDVNAIIIDVIT